MAEATRFSRLPAVRAVERFARERRLFTAGERVLAGVSGGADSVFLALALHSLAPRLGIEVALAHLDHGWRGEEAAADAALVRALGEELGVPVHTGAVDAPSLAREQRLSPEEAARTARYAFFARTCAAAGMTCVATGHTQDDQIETFLLAWLRGSGPGGLDAMDATAPLPSAPETGIRLVRPLLTLTSGEVRATLRGAGRPWREDPTNADSSLLRNRVRHELLPLLESLAPGFRKTTLRSTTLIGDAAAFLDRQAHDAASRLFEPREGALVARRAGVLGLDPALVAPVLAWAVTRLQGHRRDLEWAHLDGARRVVERGRGGARAWLSPGVQLRLERGFVVVEAVGPANPAAGGDYPQ